MCLELHPRLLGKSHHMSARGPAGDDEDIGEHDQPGDVQEGDIEALLVINSTGRDLGRTGCLRMDCDEGSPFPGWDVVPHDDRDIDDPRRCPNLEKEQSPPE